MAFSTNAGPVSYYSYDRRTRTGGFLFDSRPELARYELAPMEPFSFTARDGLTIHGYATFPPGAGRENLPMVLNVHGGPWARDAWGFDPEAQWLANRGYLCVQVNFRGSTGYGKGFVNAGDREWGGRMQDDLSDAVAYVTGQPAASRRSASTGPTRSGWRSTAVPTAATRRWPARRSRRNCSAARWTSSGPSNLKTLIETIPPYWAPMIAQFHNRVGDPDQGRRFPLVALPTVPGGGHRDPAAHRAGRQRPAGQAGRVGADRRGPGERGNRTRVPAVS